MTPEEESYQERAAILEYEANLTRDEAERLAGQVHPGPWAPKEDE